MRLALCILSALILAACARTTNVFDDSDFLRGALHHSDIANTIDVDNNSIDSFLKNEGDIWKRVRSGFQLENLDNKLVRAKTQWYADRPEYVERMINRSRLYLYYIVDQIEQRHMPTELALIPFIESAYNPQALSMAKAAGMWQFIPGTGRDYNLRQNLFQDERRDVLASTDAALIYLNRLHDMFGDWKLALAAYNWGEGNLQRAINRNASRGLPTDYLSLRIPAETKSYVPKLQALKNLISNPEHYGLKLPSVPNHPYFITVTTARDIDVEVAARLAHLSLKDFKALNPSFTKPVILGATSPQILLPFDNAECFEHNLRSFNGPLSSWTTYTVATRERPISLASKIGVDAKLLVTVNKIPSGTRLKPGSTLLIPKSGYKEIQDISADVAEKGILALEPDRLSKKRRLLVQAVRPESTSRLAGHSMKQKRVWNRLHWKRVRRCEGLNHAQFLSHVPVEQFNHNTNSLDKTIRNGSKGGNCSRNIMQTSVRNQTHKSISRLLKKFHISNPVIKKDRKTAKRSCPHKIYRRKKVREMI